MAEGRRAFQQAQYAFAAAIRSADDQAHFAGVANERLELYRHLVFNNVESFIASGYPVLRGVLTEEAWRVLVRDFLARHRSTTPYFSGIPAEFLAYLSEERGVQPDDPPFLLELAHYEWVELALSVAEEEPPQACPELMGDPLSCRIVLSPIAWPLAYRYPVHRISRNFQPAEPTPEPSCLVVYRDREDRVRFMLITPATYRWLQWVESAPGLPAIEHLERLAAELGHADATPLLDDGARALRKLAERSVIGMAET